MSKSGIFLVPIFFHFGFSGDLPNGFAMRFLYSGTSIFNLYGLPLECAPHIDRIRLVVSQKFVKSPLGDSDPVDFQRTRVDEDYWRLDCLSNEILFGKFLIVAEETSFDSTATRFCRIIRRFWDSVYHVCVSDEPLRFRPQNQLDSSRVAVEWTLLPNNDPMFRELVVL